MSVTLDMLVCMRTTLNLPDALAEAAKQRAAEEGRTFTSLVEEGLRIVLDAERAPRQVRLPAFGGRGGEMLVDIADKDALWDALDPPERRHAADASEAP
jgi:plasmid stability protein